MSKHPWLMTKPDLVVGILYDIGHDEFVVLRADGTESIEPDSAELRRLADQYLEWCQIANGYTGLYASTYSDAVARFAEGRA